MKQSTIAKLVLFFTALLWGSTFTFGKMATEVFSSSFVIFSRFFIACIVLTIVAFPRLQKIDRKYLVDGFWMGFTLFLSYILQVGGLSLDTSPGKSAFLCTTYCVLVPFLHWFVTKEKPQIHHLLCVFLSLFGVGIISLKGDIGMTLGDILTVLSGIPCAMNIVISAIVSKNRDVLLLTTIELWVVTCCALFCVLIGNELPNEYPLAAMSSILYLGIFATALCLFMQSYGLKYAEPAIAGMLLSLESVFGAIFAVMIYHEQITLRMFIGFTVIFMAILLSQWEGKKIENDRR